MAKKMTNKEFIEILEMAGIDFKTFGYEGVLNELAQNNRRLADELTTMNCKAASIKCREIADVIHEELESRGYYEDTWV